MRRSGLPFAIVRPSMLFGPGDQGINMFRAIARTGFLPLFANGTVQPVNAETVAALIVAAADCRVRDRVVEAGGPEIMTYRELADRVHFAGYIFVGVIVLFIVLVFVLGDQDWLHRGVAFGA